MTDAPPDVLAPQGAAAGLAGDVPAAVARRYLTDRRGGRGLGFYVDALTPVPAFRDEGRRLTASRNDPHVVRDLVAIARHRGWPVVRVSGETAFRREVWLAGEAQQLVVVGYRPTARDRQELERRTRREPRREPAPSAATTLAVVEAVVRSRVAEPAAQERLLASARRRLAAWLERGAVPGPPRRPPPSRDR